MSNALNLLKSEKAREEITRAQASAIQKMFEDVAKEAERQIKRLNLNTTSGKLREQYLRNFSIRIGREIEKLGAKIEGVVIDSIGATAGAVVGDTAQFLTRAGFKIKGAFSHVPTDIIHNIKTGKIYDRKWFLSEAIWGDVKAKQNALNYIVSKGLAANKSAYDIAKDIERYVDPNARKDWAWSKVYPGTSKRIDYNAQRLARTLVSHAYQQSIIMTTKDNPFVKGLKWRSAEAHGRTCELCLERHGKIYKPEELPMDHPNGLCTYIAVIPDKMEDVADRIGDWYNGKPDPELDKFAESMTNGKFKAANNLGGSQNRTQTNKPFSEKDYKKLSYDDLEKMADSHEINKARDARYNQLYRRENRTGSAYIGTGNSFDINDALMRANKNGLSLEDVLDSENVKTVRYLDEAISLGKFSEKTFVNRFVGSDYLEETFGVNIGYDHKGKVAAVEELKKMAGTKVQNSRFMCTTVEGNPCFSNRPAIMKILCDEGYECYPTTNFYEGEIILGRNTEYQLIDVRHRYDDPLTLRNHDGYEEEFKGIEIVVKMLK